MATNYSCVLTTTPTRIMPAATAFRRTHVRLSNPSAAGSAWLSHLVNTPAPNTAGSYEVPPGPSGEREFAATVNSGYCPQGEVWGVAASGTVQLTVEAE